MTDGNIENRGFIRRINVRDVGRKAKTPRINPRENQQYIMARDIKTNG